MSRRNSFVNPCSRAEPALPRPPRLPRPWPSPSPPLPPPRGPPVDTCAPGVSRSWPSVTTSSPSRSPWAMIISSPNCRDTVTGRTSAVRSGFDDVDVLAGRRRLHGGRRHHDGIRFVPQAEHHLDEEPGPQALVAIVERGLQLDRAGRRVHGVVDEAHACRLDESGLRRHRRALAGGDVVPRSDPAVAAAPWPARRAEPAPGRAPGRRAASSTGTGGFAEVAARNGERHVDRRDLIDRDERGGVVRADEIALMHTQCAGASRHRRDDARVVQVQLGVLDRGAVGQQRRLQRFNARRSASRTGRAESARACTDPRSACVCCSAFFAVAVSRASTASACCSAASNGRGSMREKQLPFPDVLPFREMHLTQLAGNLGADLDRRDRLGRPDCRNGHRDGLGLRPWPSRPEPVRRLHAGRRRHDRRHPYRYRPRVRPGRRPVTRGRRPSAPNRRRRRDRRGLKR